MAYRYTDVNTRLVYSTVKGTVGQSGKLAKFWLNPDGTGPVDLGLYSELTPDTPGASTGSNVLEVQADSMWPAMWDRAGTQDHLWMQVGTPGSPGALYRIYCDADQRLDGLSTRVDNLDTSVAGAETPAGAQAKADAAYVAARQRANHTGTQSADTLTDGTTNKAFLATERTKLAGVATGATANTTDAQLRDRSTHTGTQSADTLTDGTTAKAFLAAERTKLAGIATGATANDTDANLKARANHTGSQAISTVTGLQTALDGKPDLTGYALERAFNCVFPGAADEKIDLYFTGNVYAAIEVTLVGLYSATNASGVVRAVYSLSGSNTGTVFENTQTYTLAQGLLPTHFGLSAASWDATNSRWKISLVHRTTGANSVSMTVRWQGNSTIYTNNIRDSIGASVVYTTDVSTVAAPALSTLQKASNLSDLASVSTARTNLGVPPATRAITAGAGLTGGGDLSADRTLAVAYGTTAGTAAQGNDARIVASTVVTEALRVYSPLDPQYGYPGTGTNIGASGAAALAAMPSSGTVVGGKLVVPPGNWNLEVPWPVKSGAQIEGSGGRLASRINGSVNGVFTWNGHVSNVNFKGLRVSSTAGHIFAPSGNFAIYTTTIEECNLTQLDTTKSIFDHVSSGDYDNVNVIRCDLTILEGATVPGFNIINSGGAANQNLFADCWFHCNNAQVPMLHLESTATDNYAYSMRLERITGEQCAGGIARFLSCYVVVLDEVFDHDTTATYVNSLIHVGKSTTGGLKTAYVDARSVGRRDNTTLPAGIYDINLVPNEVTRAKITLPSHSNVGNSKLKINFLPADTIELDMVAPGTYTGQPTDARSYRSAPTHFAGGLYIGDTKKTAGTGSPEGVVTGSVGDEFFRTDESGADVVYTKRSGAATTTGWLRNRTMPAPATLAGGRRLLSGSPFPMPLATATLAIDTWRYMPLHLSAPLTVSFLTVLCSVAPTGGTAAMIFSLYGLNSAGQPTTRQADWTTYGSIDLTTGVGGEKTLTTTGLIIPAGSWAIGCAWSGTGTGTATMYATTGAHPGVAGNGTALQSSAWSQAVSGASSPATASVAGAAAQGIAIFGVLA